MMTVFPGAILVMTEGVDVVAAEDPSDLDGEAVVVADEAAEEEEAT